jgi:hypothetical protein
MTFVSSEWDMFLLEVRFITSEVTLDPKSQPAPRGLTAHVSISSGSLHMRSQNGPSCGISQFRSITLICHVIGKKKCISTNHEEKKQQEIIVQHTAPQWRLPLSLHCVLPKCTVLQLNYYKEKKNT